jgi:hypothetical protein
MSACTQNMGRLPPCIRPSSLPDKQRVPGQHDTRGYRDATGLRSFVGVDPDPANKDRIIAWAENIGSVTSFSAGGANVS